MVTRIQASLNTRATLNQLEKKSTFNVQFMQDNLFRDEACKLHKKGKLNLNNINETWALPQISWTTEKQAIRYLLKYL